MQNKRRGIVVFITVILLLIPFIAMQFTDEVNWAPSDFMMAAALLLSTGFLLDLIIRKIKNVKYRIAISIVLLIVFLLIWVELAIGIL